MITIRNERSTDIPARERIARAAHFAHPTIVERTIRLVVGPGMTEEGCASIVTICSMN